MVLLYIFEYRAMIGAEFARTHRYLKFQVPQVLLLHLVVLAHLVVCIRILIRTHLRTVVTRRHHHRKVEDLCRMWDHPHRPFILLITEDPFVGHHLIGIS